MKRNKQKSRRNVLRAEKREGQAISNLFQATLQTPFEVDVHITNHPDEQCEQLRGHWVLWGTISRRAFAALMAHDRHRLEYQLIAYPTPSGAAYAILVGQLGTWQCRLMFALYDPKAIAFLEAVKNEPFKLRLTNNYSSDESLTYECNLPPDDLRAVGDMCVEVNVRNVLEVSFEAAMFMDELMHPLALSTTLTPADVRDVDVSVLFPGPSSSWCGSEAGIEEWA